MMTAAKKWKTFLHIISGVVFLLLSACLPGNENLVKTVPAPTASSTLSAMEAQTQISQLMAGSADCLAPCFWGITPTKTTLLQAEEALKQLGLETWRTSLGDNNYLGFDYSFQTGLSIHVRLNSKDEVVDNIKFSITPSYDENLEDKKWSAYTLKNLIMEYGSPSKVEFFVGLGEVPSYFMIVYFDNVDMIVEYISYEMTFNNDIVQICPTEDQVSRVEVWLGQFPENPPLPGISLADATSLDLVDFGKLFTGNSNERCINLRREFFQ